MCVRTLQRWLAGLVIGVLGHGPALAQPASDVLAGFEAANRAAEDSLRAGERQLADSRYRGVVMNGWLLLGGLEGADGRGCPRPGATFERASVATVQPREARLHALVLVHLVLEGDPATAINNPHEARGSRAA